MADLAFVNQHNMVAYLEKSDENAEFHQIVDFLSTCSINYALTVSPTIYASYIEQFWNTATSKIVNSVKQIHAIVDGKAVVISESSVRNDLLFDDEDGITCLTNDDIFENLALMGYEQTAFNENLLFKRQSKSFSGKVTPLFESMLVQNQAPEGESLVTPPEPQPTPSTSQPNVSEPQTELLQTETPPTVSHEPQTEANIEQILPSPSIYQRKHKKTQKHRRAKKVTELPQTSMPLDLGVDEAVHKEGVFDLEKEKDAQPVEILKLKKRVKKLERQRKSSISHPRRRIYRHVESSDDDLDEEDASKQGRKSDKIKTMFKDSDFDRLNDDIENVNGETIYAATSGVSITGALVSTVLIPTDTMHELAQLLHQEELAQVERRQRERAEQEEASIAALYEKLYEREQKWIIDFFPIDFEKEEKKSIEPQSKGKKGKRKKRVADSALKHKSSKKQKMMQEQESAKSDEDAAADYEHEKEELRMWNVDMEDLHVYKIIRADMNTSYHKSLFSMLRKFDRQDLVDLHRLVMKRFEDNNPKDDDIWSNQQDWTLISWKLYENIGIHTLLMDGTLTCFNMLVEKRYLLIKEMLEKMLNWKLEAEAESTLAFELLKFIKGGLLGIMDFYKLVLLVQLDTAGDAKEFKIYSLGSTDFNKAMLIDVVEASVEVEGSLFHP
ncbi:hypothetical protein Tco_1313388 [Tanacetum coccineum]